MTTLKELENCSLAINISCELNYTTQEIDMDGFESCDGKNKELVQMTEGEKFMSDGVLQNKKLKV